MNRPTLMQRINRRLDARRNGEAGLALLDVLLGMAIFALIAVIAVQAMGMYRDRAAITTITSDLKQVESAVMAAMTEPGADVWDVTPAGVRNATSRHWNWWIMGMGGGGTPGVSGVSLLDAGLSPDELGALGINLTNPDTTKVVIVPVAQMLGSIVGNVEATGDEFFICLHDTKTGVYARKVESFKLDRGAGSEIIPQTFNAGEFYSGACIPGALVI